MNSLNAKALRVSQWSVRALVIADAAIVSFVFCQSAYYQGDGLGNLPLGAPGWMYSLKEAMGWVIFVR